MFVRVASSTCPAGWDGLILRTSSSMMVSLPLHQLVNPESIFLAWPKISSEIGVLSSMELPPSMMDEFLDLEAAS